MKNTATKTGARRPFVFVNMAMTADGKIATANRAITSFGSARDQRQLYVLRATADAILCGARTVEQSRTLLDSGGVAFSRSRVRRGLAAHALRIVATGSGSLDSKAELFRHRFSPIIVLTTGRAPARKLAQLRALADEVLICGEAELDFSAALGRLWAEWGVKRLLVEGGGELNAALFAAGLVDEIHLTLCPKNFGGRNAPTIADGPGATSLAGTEDFKIKSIRNLNGELFTVFSRAKKAKPPG